MPKTYVEPGRPWPPSVTALTQAEAADLIETGRHNTPGRNTLIDKFLLGQLQLGRVVCGLDENGALCIQVSKRELDIANAEAQEGC